MKILSRQSKLALALLSLTVCAGAYASDRNDAADVRKSQSLTDTGFNLMLSKDYVDAEPYFQRALAIEPNLAMAHLDLGAAYQDAGNRAAATEQFNLAIADDTKENNFPSVKETTDGSSGTVTEIANRNIVNMK